MTNIIRLADNEGDKRPTQARVYAITHKDDDIIAIEKFLIRYGKTPEKAYLWRGNLYVEVEDK